MVWLEVKLSIHRSSMLLLWLYVVLQFTWRLHLRSHYSTCIANRSRHVWSYNIDSGFFGSGFHGLYWNL